MSRFVRTHALSRSALLLAIALAYRDARAQERTGPAAATQNQEGVLVLQDGGVLSGQIAREDEQYVVTRAGGRMNVAASRVLFVCGSLEEAYQYRRRQLARPTAEAHLALAEWCLRYELIAPARRELTEARALDARHPRLALLERRLEYASQPPRSPAVAKSAARPPSAAAETAAPPRTADSSVSPRVIERFTRKVQPVLVNNCTTAGCHQPGGAEPFQLDRALLHGLANRRSTMSNLAATLALVDRERPQLSPLLTVPRRAHGGMADPIIGPRDEQAFTHLEDWVALVTQADSYKSPGTRSPDAEADLLAADAVQDADDSAASELFAPGESEPPRRKSVYESATGAVLQANHDEEAVVSMPLPATQQLRFGAQVEKWVPRDPFDPEIFNRQIRARRRAATMPIEDAVRAAQTNPRREIP